MSRSRNGHWNKHILVCLSVLTETCLSSFSSSAAIIVNLDLWAVGASHNSGHVYNNSELSATPVYVCDFEGHKWILSHKLEKWTLFLPLRRWCQDSLPSSFKVECSPTLISRPSVLLL